MRLYDFSVAFERREALRRERAAAEAVIEVIEHLQEPGSVIELKRKVDGWFSLHREVLKKIVNLL